MVRNLRGRSCLRAALALAGMCLAADLVAGADVQPVDPDRQPARQLETPSGDLPPAQPVAVPEFHGIRLIEVFRAQNTTKMVLQSDQALVTGQAVFVGPKEVPVTLGDVLSTGGGLHYYSASAPGKVKVKPGDVVALQPSRKPSLPESILASLTRGGSAGEPKAVAQITAVQLDRVMIDKGTLHQVRERDLYRIFDSSGQYRGILEVGGIGDLQSSGRLYSRWEDRKRGQVDAKPGDTAVYAGQRRFFGTGFIGGGAFQRRKVLEAYEKAAGGGMLWSITFYNRWGVEILAGYYQREGKDAANYPGTPPGYADEVRVQNARSVRFLAPIWVKKSFFYPSVTSPFVAAGFSPFRASHAQEHLNTGNVVIARQSKIRKGIVPMAGAGVEFFPARFIRPRIEVRHFFGPELKVLDNGFRTETTFYSAGVVAAW